MLRYSTKQTWRNWQLFLPIFLCVVVATSIFTSTSLAANVMQIVLTEDVVNGVAVDMTYASFLPPDQLFQLRQDIDAIDEIKSTELIIRHTNVTFGGSEGIITTAIQSNSSIYEGITPLFGTTELGVNETLIASTSLRINEFPVGSNYTLRFAIEFANGSTQWVYLSLTVVGQISIIPSALNAIAGLYAVDGWYPPGDEWRLNKASYLIVDLDETFLPLLQYSLSFNDSETTYLGRILHINLDHSSVIDPLDIAGSAQKVDFLGSQIKQILDYALENHLATALTLFYQRMELNRVMVFQISTITILLTIYVAFTLSEVTLTVKKQEIGLLLLKGGTRQKIQNSSLLQALLLGVFGSLVGLTCTLMVSPFLLNSFLYFGLTLALLGKDTILLTGVIGFVTAFIAVYLPVQKVSRFSPRIAQEYYPSTNNAVKFQRLFAWGCLFLGGFKFILILFNINIVDIVNSLRFTNLLLATIVGGYSFFDTILGVAAPLIFCWGFVTLLIKGGAGFFNVVSSWNRRLFGALGGLAAVSLKQNKRQISAIMFLCILLLGYSVYSIGVLASHQDFVIRSASTEIGADLRVKVTNSSAVDELLIQMDDIEGIREKTSEYSFNLDLLEAASVRAINTTNWLNVAYFEPEWFSGSTLQFAFSELAANPYTIILERRLATKFGLSIGSEILIQNPSNGSYLLLEVVGYFGPIPKWTPHSLYTGEWVADQTWSYVSIDLLSEIEVISEGWVLIALDSPNCERGVIESIMALDGAQTVNSIQQRLDELASNAFHNAFLNSLLFGVNEAFLLSVFGIVIIIFFTLRTRRVHLALLSARGSSYKQTVQILSIEFLSVFSVSIFAGLLTGVIMLYGALQATLAFMSPILVVPRLFPPSFLLGVSLGIGASIGLMALAFWGPILSESYFSRYDTIILR